MHNRLPRPHVERLVESAQPTLMPMLDLYGRGDEMPVQTAERLLLVEALAKSDMRLDVAAAQIGMTPRQFTYRLNKLERRLSVPQRET